MAAPQSFRPMSANPFKESGLGSMSLGPDEAPSRPGSSEPSEIQFVVAKLNEVLRTKYTLVSFDQKRDRDLLQVLNDVVASLDPKMKIDVTTEDPQATMTRLGDFLERILGYKVTPDKAGAFQNALLTGEKQMLYSILNWVLSRMKENEKRVYLAKFLIPVDVPEDMRASDDGVQEVFQQYRILVEQFKECHKNVEKLKSAADPVAAKEQIQKLEQDKEQLTLRVGAIKKKLERFPAHDAVFKVSRELRGEVEEEKQLTNLNAEQLAGLKMTEQRIAMAQARLRSLSKDFGDMDVSKLIKSLQDELAANKQLLTDKLPKQIQEYSDKLHSVTSLLNETTESPEQLQRDILQIEREIDDIEQKSRAKLDAKEESALELFRRQAKVIASRKESILAEIESQQSQKLRLQEELQEREAELYPYRGAKMFKGEDFKAYANALRGKSNTYKRMKAEIQEIKAELGVLQRTEEVLVQRHQAVADQLTQIEKAKGIHGYRDKQEELLKLTEGKMEVDEAKGKTLEELSKVVQEFVANIRERRNKLAPQILELRNTRQKSQAVEQEYQQKKETYESIQHELEAEISKLQQEVDLYSQECHENESLYHRLNCQATIYEVANKRVQDEKEFRANTRKYSERFRSNHEMFEHTIADLERISKDLRERKREIEENHDANLQQMAWFKNLKRLLECKIAYYKREQQDRNQRPALGAIETVAIGRNPLGQMGVDRLVLS
eukprot:TRINITY_DN1889_c0_g1_i1.p1 TRINITY_DN1889_c0_g1~~TRINITY_DN1889_c0_g1_i1.p1  ORF type:complete len:725 (+),score=205.41 TRINITY_DN1889_c0_g1_i1:117-2291(+)